jgi:hypothetical protein
MFKTAVRQNYSAALLLFFILFAFMIQIFKARAGIE